MIKVATAERMPLNSSLLVFSSLANATIRQLPGRSHTRTEFY